MHFTIPEAFGEANLASGWVAVDAAANLRKLAEALPELELILQVNQDQSVMRMVLSVWKILKLTGDTGVV